MIIELKRTGGFAGIPLNIVCDTTQLDLEECNSILAMVESADFFSLPDKIPPTHPKIDRVFYRITVEKPDARHTVEVSESDVPEPLQPLIRRVIILGRGTQRR